jgi:hypothetical protein
MRGPSSVLKARRLSHHLTLTSASLLDARLQPRESGHTWEVTLLTIGMFFPQDLPETEAAAIRQFLSAAFARKLRGDPGNYNVVIEQLEKRNDEEMLWKV